SKYKEANETFGVEKYIPCIVHTINLIVTNTIEKCTTLNDIIVKIRKIVKYIKNSVNLSDELRKLQKDQGLPDGKILKLVLDVKTRWNSLLYMIERFLNIFRIISVIILDKSTAPDFVTAHELNTIREIKMLLQPFEDLTKKVSDDKFSIMTNILFELNKRFKDLEIFYNFPLSTLLDPRFKNLHFKDPTRCHTATEKIKNVLISKENSPNNDLNEPPAPAQSLSVSSELPPVPPSFDLWTYLEAVANVQISQRTTPMYQELYDYLAKPVIDIKTDPLYAWEEMKTMYPNLYIIAREKLSIIATSVPSERLFPKLVILYHKPVTD
ncbi:zinc finger BED domain-containing protein 4-like, partial [Aphis craccivora]